MDDFHTSSWPCRIVSYGPNVIIVTKVTVKVETHRITSRIARIPSHRHNVPSTVVDFYRRLFNCQLREHYLSHSHAYSSIAVVLMRWRLQRTPADDATAAKNYLRNFRLVSRRRQRQPLWCGYFYRPTAIRGLLVIAHYHYPALDLFCCQAFGQIRLFIALRLL